jgi:hypothetical protein
MVVCAVAAIGVLGYQAILVNTKKTSNRADEAAIECAARELVPFFGFESFEEAGADASGGGDFVE